MPCEKNTWSIAGSTSCTRFISGEYGEERIRRVRDHLSEKAQEQVAYTLWEGLSPADYHDVKGRDMDW